MNSKIVWLSLFCIILIGCNKNHCINGVQDGNETGVDCGGDCPPCDASGNVTQYTIDDIAGLWYVTGIHGYTSGLSVLLPVVCNQIQALYLEIKNPNFPRNSQCKLLISNIPHSNGGNNVYESNGWIPCGYDSGISSDLQSVSMGAENTVTIDGFGESKIIKLTATDLVIASTLFNNEIHFKKSPISPQNYQIVEWKVELTENYIQDPNKDSTWIWIHGQGVHDYIMVIPGVNIYQGQYAVDFSTDALGNCEFTSEIWVLAKQSTTQWNPNPIKYKTEVKVNDFISSGNWEGVGGSHAVRMN